MSSQSLAPDTDPLQRLFERHFGQPAESVEPLHGQLGGSERHIVRLSAGPHRVIGVQHAVREENAAFIGFSRHFHKHGLPVPRIYADALDEGVYIEEDLGDTTLFQYLAAHRSGGEIAPAVVEAYRKVVAALPRFQFEAGRDLDYGLCYPRASFDGRSMAWDLSSFKSYFLRPAGIPFNEQTLEDDFVRLTEFLLTADGRDYFLYRDFQSRNIMLRDGSPFFIDYQNGRHGAPQYDVASLLYDAKADLPPEFRQHLLDDYLARLGGFTDIMPAAFMRHYYAYVYIRIMQAMGAYGLRGFFERKTLFLQSVPYAIKNLGWLLSHVEIPVALPALMGVFRSLVNSERYAASGASRTEPITVRVFSFSYRQAPPQDDTGNGGGFVFDARSLPNPGREPRYRAMTGRDPLVIEYLAREDRVREYLTHVIALVDASVDSYRNRGFKDLMVAFGCTGGQHRSVYLAEQLAKHLQAQPGVSAPVTHLEQSRWPQ